MIKPISLVFFLSLALNALAVTPEKLEKAKAGDDWAMLAVADEYCQEDNYRESLYWQEQRIYALESKAKTDQDEKDVEFAMSTLADAYARGTCAPYGPDKKPQQFIPNYPMALKWYQRLAYKSSPKSYFPYGAKLKIAEMYYWGREGVEKNISQAKAYYKELASFDDAVINKLPKNDQYALKETRGNARWRLAQMHFLGDHATKDHPRALQWAEKGGRDDNPYAMIIVAFLLYQGEGVKHNKQEALKLMGLVCDNFGNENACNWYQDIKANKRLRPGGL
ncbi:tetratricopeptide repeat protein [Avibacterium avium]|uniref:tetratricopeptide repeat protein n=1 Tax=Avibacterium avium TaxID=751 RepID=UPI003BF7D4E8